VARRRPVSARRLRDDQPTEHIRRIHTVSGETYGARRIHRRLRREGVTAARRTIERLMREDGLEGVIRGRRRRTTVTEPSAPRPPDLVNRRFTAHRPDQLWVAGLTCIRTWPGWVYVASVLGVDSRMTVGWRLATRMRTGLPPDTPEMALWTERLHSALDYLPPEEFEAQHYRSQATTNAA